MTEPNSPALPAWVSKRDGRLEPFEADKISRALFAATEALARPDPFLARELTDSVLHFLAGEGGEGVPATSQIAELVAKVVRELGQPELAHAFVRARAGEPPPASALARPKNKIFDRWIGLRLPATDRPETVVRQCLREWSLQTIFSPDLAAAHRDGLIFLAGLEAPRQLLGCIFDLPGGVVATGTEERKDFRRPGRLVQALHDIRAKAGAFVVLDSPEILLGQRGFSFRGMEDFVETLAVGLKSVDLGAVVNVNCASLPPWAEEAGGGPLFARASHSRAKEEVIQEALLDQFLGAGAAAGRVRLDWHLSDADFAGAPDQPVPSLLRLARRALEHSSLCFTFDRPRRPVALAEGMDRKYPAVLLAVGLNLPRLLDRAGIQRNTDSFLRQVASLARMAVSAGMQRRNSLRKQAAPVSQEFLLDRARLVVVPVGLDATVRMLTGQGLTEGQSGLELAVRLLTQMHGFLRREGQTAGLDICLDGPWQAVHRFGESAKLDAVEEVDLAHEPVSPQQVAGLTAWDERASPDHQVRVAGALHAVAGQGTAAVLVTRDSRLSPEEVVALLHFAWKRTELVRLRFVRATSRQKQLTFLSPG